MTNSCINEVLASEQYQIQFGGVSFTFTIDIANEIGCSVSDGDSSLLNCIAEGNFEQVMQIPFLVVEITFLLYSNGNAYELMLTMSRPILGGYPTLYAKNNFLVIMQRAIYVKVYPDSN